MTEERKEQLRAAREEVIAWCPDGIDSVRAHDLYSIDSALEEYVITVLTFPEGHNLWELLALRRFVRMLDRYVLDTDKVRHVLKVMRRLKFVTDRGMQPLELTPLQVYALTNIYGFLREDKRRLFRYVLFFVPRKFGKTTISAGISTYELVFGEADGQIYTCANSYQQAKLCFDNIRYAARSLDPSGRSFKVNREVIFNLRPGRSNFARCLAADASTLDGLNASLYILDEFAQARDSALRNVMATSNGTRANPLEIIITTASDVLDGPCVSTLEAYKKILLGEQEDDSVFALIFEPDIDDEESDPSTWKKVQPHMGITVKEDYYAEWWRKAQQTAEDMLAFRTKLLNIFAVNEEQAWITAPEIRKLMVPFSWDSVNAQPFCMVAIDLSVWDDFSCACYAIYKSGKFHFHHEFYMPEESVDRHPQRALYRQWANDGYLTLLPGKTIDYIRIADDIVGHNGTVRIIGIAYDPYKSKDCINVLAASGAGSVLSAYKQTYGNFTGPVETMEMLVKREACTFTYNPIIAYCYGNCRIDEDRLGNRKPVKRAAAGKIDGAITDLMAVGLFASVKR